MSARPIYSFCSSASDVPGNICFCFRDDWTHFLHFYCFPSFETQFSSGFKSIHLFPCFYFSFTHSVSHKSTKILLQCFTATVPVNGRKFFSLKKTPNYKRRFKLKRNFFLENFIFFINN